jgi:hypothetical protein
MHLIVKEKEIVPPPTLEDHLDTIYAKRMSASGKLRSYAIKSMIRIATKVSKGEKTE